MILAYVPKVIQWCFPRRQWHKSRQKKTLYLTFDDGPIPEITPWVLEQLKTYDAKATFFCIGENIKKHPKVFQQIIQDGHVIGNHTQNHINGWHTDTGVYLENVALCNSEIINSQSSISNIFRPPFGKLKPSQAKKLLEKGYEIIMWDVLSLDYDIKTSKEKCLSNVLKHSKNGSIIIFHDSLKAEKNLRYALPKGLKELSEKGYEFKSL